MIGGLSAAAGAIFLLQGLGYLGGSVMTGDPTWAYVGGAMLLLGTILAATALRRRRR